MFDLLLERGASAEGDNKLYDYWSPMLLSVHRKRRELTHELARRVGHISLIDALFMGDDATALLILQVGEIMLQRTMPNDATMLHFTVTPDPADRLIELGVPLSTKDKFGRTALDQPAAMGARDVVDVLVDHGAEASSATRATLGISRRSKPCSPAPRPTTTCLSSPSSPDRCPLAARPRRRRQRPREGPVAGHRAAHDCVEWGRGEGRAASIARGGPGGAGPRARDHAPRPGADGAADDGKKGVRRGGAAAKGEAEDMTSRMWDIYASVKCRHSRTCAGCDPGVSRGREEQGWVCSI